MRSTSKRINYSTQNQIINDIHDINNELAAYQSIRAADYEKIEELQNEKHRKLLKLRRQQQNVRNNRVYRERKRERHKKLEMEHNINLTRDKRGRRRIEELQGLVFFSFYSQCNLHYNM